MIKNQSASVCKEFGIHNKVYKVVCDQAANVKSAYKDTEESIDLVNVARNLMNKQRNIDAIELNRKKESEKLREKQVILIDNLQREVDEFNFEFNKPKATPGVGLKRDCVIAGLDNDDYDDYDEETEQYSDDDASSGEENEINEDDSADDAEPFLDEDRICKIL